MNEDVKDGYFSVKIGLCGGITGRLRRETYVEGRRLIVLVIEAYIHAIDTVS